MLYVFWLLLFLKNIYIISILRLLHILYSIEYLCDITVINYIVLACKLYNKTTKYRQVIISSKMMCFYYTLEYFIDIIMQYVLMFRPSVCTDDMSDHIKLKCQHL